MSLNFKLSNVCLHSTGPCQKEKLLTIISNAGADKFKECFEDELSYTCLKGLVKRIFTTELDNEDKMFCLECYLIEKNSTTADNFGAVVNLHWLAKDKQLVKLYCHNCEIPLISQNEAVDCEFCKRESILHEEWLDMFGVVNVRTTDFEPAEKPEPEEDIYMEMNKLVTSDLPNFDALSKEISKIGELTEELSKRKKSPPTYTLTSYDSVVKQHTVECKIEDMTFKGKGSTHLQAKAIAATKAIKMITQKKGFFSK